MRCIHVACLFTVMVSFAICPIESHCQSPQQPGSAEKSPTREQELRKGLMGVWKLHSGVNQGRELSAAEVDGTTVVVKDLAVITYDKDQRERYRASYILDASTKPIEITMTAEIDGKPPGKALGILKTTKKKGQQRITGWTLCYALPGNPRPEAFESEAGSSVMLFKMKRADVDESASR